jgi:small subunit ribosomal protein S21
MLIVEINKKQNLDKALKVLKGKVIKTKQNEKLRARLQFMKPSIKKRGQKLKAKYVQSMKTND